MLGAICGDIVGSVYEFKHNKKKDVPLFTNESKFTDDSVLTVATAKAILENKTYQETAREIGRKYPGAGWGGRFGAWLFGDNPRPYGSWGNGSAMRVSPVAFAFNDEKVILSEAGLNACFSHNHTEGIKGAQATALAIFLARTGKDKSNIRQTISEKFGYKLDRTVDEIRPSYRFNESCEKTVPEAIISFLDSTDYEDTIRNAISLGGDADTLACIAGGIAEAYYGKIPEYMNTEVKKRLDPELYDIMIEFYNRYIGKKYG